METTSSVVKLCLKMVPECVGEFMLSDVFIVYGAVGAMPDIFVGKLLGHMSP